jgi:hypothetical protein
MLRGGRGLSILAVYVRICRDVIRQLGTVFIVFNSHLLGFGHQFPEITAAKFIGRRFFIAQRLLLLLLLFIYLPH